MFEGWENVYLMLGPAAAGLIGLLFVVVTLTSGQDRSKTQRGQALYMTPTVVQFAVVMVIGAVAMAPRLGPLDVAVAIGLATALGLGNAIRACLGIRSLELGEYNPHWSDFWCYGVAPAVVYLALAGVTVALCLQVPWAAEALAATVMLLLLVGIRNAWDLVTWIAPMRGGGGPN